MSPGNQGVFQLLKEVAFRGILAFYDSRKWGYLGWFVRGPVRFWLAGGNGPENHCFVLVIPSLRVCATIQRYPGVHDESPRPAASDHSCLLH